MNLKEEAINQNLINAIKEKVTGTPVEIISQILPLSKEAIYRRMRGDVLFTFSEAVLIADTLKISLDETAIIQGEFQLSKYQNGSNNQFDIQSYNNELTKWVEILQYYTDRPDSQTYAAIPELLMPFFTPFHESQLKLLYFQTLFENGGLDNGQTKISDIKIPSQLLEQFKLCSEAVRNNNMTCIIDSKTFSYYLKKLEYMRMLGFIEEKEIEELKADLHDSLEYLQNICKIGHYPSGKTFTAYICELNISSSFNLWEDSYTSTLLLRQLGMNYTIFTNPNIIKKYKQVFNNLRNFSTLISGSGSTRRIDYFKEQFSLFK